MYAIRQLHHLHRLAFLAPAPWVARLRLAAGQGDGHALRRLLRLASASALTPVARVALQSVGSPADLAWLRELTFELQQVCQATQAGWRSLSRVGNRVALFWVTLLVVYGFSGTSVSGALLGAHVLALLFLGAGFSFFCHEARHCLHRRADVLCASARALMAAMVAEDERRTRHFDGA
ncbi:MAG: hypothetical protein ACPGUV_13285 [Polyangiales bacterium]